MKLVQCLDKFCLGVFGVELLISGGQWTMSIGHGIVATGDPKAGQLENVGLTLTCSVEILAAPKLPSAVVTFCLVYLASSPNLQGKCTSQDQPLI